MCHQMGPLRFKVGASVYTSFDDESTAHISFSPKCLPLKSVKNNQDRLVAKRTDKESAEANFHYRYSKDKQTLFVPSADVIPASCSTVFLIFPLFGSDLLQLVANSCSIPPTIFMDMVSKLQLFHEAYGTHGDIKPENVVLLGNSVRLIDMECFIPHGVSKPSPPVASMGSLKITMPSGPAWMLNMRHGTSSYMCLEKVLYMEDRKGEYDRFKNDLYGAAATIVACVTQKNPPGTHTAILKCIEETQHLASDDMTRALSQVWDRVHLQALRDFAWRTEQWNEPERKFLLDFCSRNLLGLK
jgi:serine/threonine protein kinase